MQPVLKFQNILCYCLSSFAGILTCRPYNFKTSYVIVYRIRHSCSDFSHSLFQNILCYCLSQQFDFAICYQLEFQNILCYCLSACKALKWRGWADFKTSYVIVYHTRRKLYTYSARISKHLMLLFIILKQLRSSMSGYFKTSYVIVYRFKVFRKSAFLRHFKTSYVIVYHFRVLKEVGNDIFQNILCYCLSSVVTIGLNIRLYFKTSYVIVYLPSPLYLQVIPLFQNILCYCLSLSWINWRVACPSFQNILCYCLSDWYQLLCHLAQLFQNILCYCLSISFIDIIYRQWFQNILCYCLSLRFKRFSAYAWISKHLMLLFIQSNSVHCQKVKQISKHLMLLFITVQAVRLIRVLAFQNILCYCLSEWKEKELLSKYISKHLMLLFIEVDTINFAGYIFQNILCYCLSLNNNP